MITLTKASKWVLAIMMSTTLVFISSCGGDDPEPDPDPDPIIPPSGLTYETTTVAVGSEGTITPTIEGDEATFEITNQDDVPFVSINAVTGVLSVAKETTTGTYTVNVTAENAEGSTEGTAEITIGVNEAFDPTGKELMWKYWMNNTEGVVFENLNTLPGQGDLPAEIPIPVGWPAGWPAIDVQDPTLPTYFTFPMVQGFLLQVPGDDVCKALDPAESGNTLLVIVNPDLTLSTVCTKDETEGTTVEIGISKISFSDDKFTWFMDVALEGVPVTYAIGDARIADFTDPLDPHFLEPSGVPRTFSAIQGTIDQYLTPTDFADYLGSLAILNVDVVLEILPE